MKLCLFDGGRLGVVRQDRIFDASDVLRDLAPFEYGRRAGDPLLADLQRLLPKIEEAATRSEGVPVSSVTLEAPVGWPGKLIAAPVNYNDHLAEAQADPTTFAPAQVKRIHEIGLFLKATSSFVGPGAGITRVRPERRTDHEIELAVVIGTGGKDIARGDALDHVAAYAIGLDITVRGPEERSLRKSADSYSVMGPWMVTRDEIPDPGNLDFALTVNGEVRQRANTRDLVIDVPGLIEMASSWYRLEPGDVIFTGTPAGVGPIADGDVLVASFERIGTMEVRVHAA